MARRKQGIFARIVGAVSAFNVGRAVGRHVDRRGLAFDDDLRDELNRIWGREGRLAFAAGLATFGWALVRQREAFFVLLAGALVGWRAWEKLLEAMGVQRRLEDGRVPVETGDVVDVRRVA